VSCDAERITGYVDAALDEIARAEVAGHLAGCPVCREQADFERELHARLRQLPEPEPRAGLEADVRKQLRRATPSRLRWALPLAAGLAALVFLARGSAPIVAWELAHDHAHCFSKPRLPAEVWGADPEEVTAWFAARGTRLPTVPAAAGGMDLVGGRFCPLPDGSKVAHLYYVGEGRRLSLFVLSHDVFMREAYAGSARGAAVRLSRSDGATLGLVSEKAETVESFRRNFATTVASAAP
jgi:anti-sigma factor RsiW